MTNKKKQKGEIFSTRITDPDLLAWFHKYNHIKERNPAWTLRHALEFLMDAEKDLEQCQGLYERGRKNE